MFDGYFHRMSTTGWHIWDLCFFVSYENCFKIKWGMCLFQLFFKQMFLYFPVVDATGTFSTLLKTVQLHAEWIYYRILMGSNASFRNPCMDLKCYIGRSAYIHLWYQFQTKKQDNALLNELFVDMRTNQHQLWIKNYTFELWVDSGRSREFPFWKMCHLHV